MDQYFQKYLDVVLGSEISIITARYSYFCGAVVKCHVQKQLKEKKVYFGLGSSRIHHGKECTAEAQGRKAGWWFLSTYGVRDEYE